ncbi:MAG: diphthine--ammonia ligase [Actinobacteria bacterium]|nr:diphthine--ammonia ligase [Actinomycetota bacterium]
MTVDELPAHRAGEPIFCSWSGGKDSAWALHQAARAGASPRLLLSMMVEGGERSRSHGVSREVLAAQAAALGIPIRFGAASWTGYEEEFHRLLVTEAVAAGTTVGIFGDIDLQEHRAWVERVCGEAGVRACLPLWQRDRRAVVDELLGAGLEAVIVAVRDGVLPTNLLGRTLDPELVAEIERHGADAAGESGEYHSLVVNGPLFQRRLEVEPGERTLRDGVWFLDLAVAG